MEEMQERAKRGRIDQKGRKKNRKEGGREKD